MTLDKLPGTKIFVQRDVRETPKNDPAASTTLSFITVANEADLSAERRLVAGAGIDLTDAGAGTTITISGETASTTNAGIIEIATGAETNTGTDATRAVSPDALDDWTGSAQITTVAEAAVTAHEGAIDHDALTNFTADEHFTEASIDHTAITNIGTNSHADIDTHIAGDGSDHSLLANKTSYWSATGGAFRAASSATYDDDAVGIMDMNTGDYIWCPVNLPHGAVVTGAVVYGSGAETWLLQRKALDGTSVESTMATAAIDAEDTTITNATIDNSAYVYFFQLEAAGNTTIHGARVKYTTDYD